MQSIHTNEVEDYMDTREDNKVLIFPAPEFSADEEKLSRKTSGILAQLRSGYSPHLRAYLKRTGVEDSDLCPDCNKEKHTTNHLFYCEANPTKLCVLSLWDSPTEAANFLRLQDDDSTEAASWAKAINKQQQQQQHASFFCFYCQDPGCSCFCWQKHQEISWISFHDLEKSFKILRTLPTKITKILASNVKNPRNILARKRRALGAVSESFAKIWNNFLIKTTFSIFFQIDHLLQTTPFCYRELLVKN